MTQPNPPAPEAPQQAPAQEPATPPTWDELFKDQDPVKVKEALENSRKWEQRAKENKTAAERLAQLEESQKTEQQKLADRATAAERAASEAQRELLRMQVITETGLPADLHEFVTGNDEDELRAKANKLKAQFSAEQRSVDVGLGSRQTAPVQDMNWIFRKAAGRA